MGTYPNILDLSHFFGIPYAQFNLNGKEVPIDLIFSLFLMETGFIIHISSFLGTRFVLNNSVNQITSSLLTLLMLITIINANENYLFTLFYTFQIKLYQIAWQTNQILFYNISFHPLQPPHTQKITFEGR